MCSGNWEGLEPVPQFHFKRMELERIGTLPIDTDKLRRLLPSMPPGTPEAIDDVSIANGLNVGSPNAAVRWRKPD